MLSSLRVITSASVSIISPGDDSCKYSVFASKYGSSESLLSRSQCRE